MFKQNFKKALACLLIIAVFISSVSAVVIGTAAADPKQTLNISVVTTDTGNDLLKILQANYDGIKQYSNIQTAVSNVDTNGTKAIMVLAGAGANYQYANTSTDAITADVYQTLQSKGVRIYVEFPKNNSAIGVTGYTQYGESGAVGNMGNEYRRAIVTDASKTGLAANTLLYALGARYLKKTDLTHSWLVHAKVAGYDTLAYNDFTDANSQKYSFLETNAEGDVLIAATKLSGFATGRYVPTSAWKTLWCSILSYLTGVNVNSIEYTPLMTAAYTADEALPSTAYTDAVSANMQWYYNNMVSKEEGKEEGWGGFYQRYRSDKWGWSADGNQNLDKTIRADCTGESIGAMAIASVLLNNNEYRQIAYNAMDWMLNESNMANGDRHNNVNNSQYGLFGWYDDWNDSSMSGNVKSYYGDDNAKAILGLILGASALGTDEFDTRILEAIMGNFRTTGTNGFRTANLNGSSMNGDWKTYYKNASDEDLRAHFQALLWACYLWAYEKTGYEPFYERSVNAIGIMMTAYEDTVDGKDDGNGGEWTWTNSLQADRAKMAWALAWLVRVSPTQEHIGWLNTMINDMMQYQDAETGAIGEDLDSTKGHGDCDAPESNAEYGTKEAPVIHNADDPATDLLYVSGFAHTALNEAVTALQAAGQDTAAIEQKRDKLANFHVRIQQESTSAAYDGAWFRGFDYDKWEVYGSASDSGWNVWDTETGWTNAQISSALALQQMNSSVWDYTEQSAIGNVFEQTATAMLASEYTAPTATISSDVTLRWDASVLVDGNYADDDATKWNTGKWTGAEGTNITLTIDYGLKKTFDNVTIGFDQYASLGAFIPKSITIYTSNDGSRYTQVGKHDTGVNVQAKYDAWYNNGTNDASQIYIDRIKTTLDQTVTARYVKIVVENPMQSYSAAHTGGTVAKTWIFMDEIELGNTIYTAEDLKALIDTAYSVNTAGKQPESVIALETALDAAEEYYNLGATDKNELKRLYTTLEAALSGLKDVAGITVNSATPNTNGDSWPSINSALDGDYTNEAARWNLLSASTGTQKKTVTWNGNYDTNLADDGETGADWEHAIIIDSAEELHYLLRRAYLSDTKYYKVAEDISAFNLNNAGVTESTDYATAKSKLTSTNTLDWKGTDNSAFGGHIDFNGATIAGMYCTGQRAALIFQTIAAGAEIKNLTIVNSYIKGTTHYAAAIFGNSAGAITVENCEIVDCYIENAGSSGYGVGAIGCNATGALNIKNCFVKLDSNEFKSNATKATHYNDKSVGETVDGGLVAKSTYSTVITNCLVLGIKPYSTVTGAVGANYSASFTTGVYTDQSVIDVQYNLHSNINVINIDNIKGANAKNVLTALDFDTVWLSGDEGELPRLSFGIVEPEEDPAAAQVILDMGESTGIYAVGYAAKSQPSIGIYMQNAVFYVSDSPDGDWQQVAAINGTAHKGAAATAEYQTLTAAANGKKGRYVKVAFSDCRDHELTNASEWLYLSEILINKFCPITVETENATVNMTDSDGNEIGLLGAIYGKDVTVNITPTISDVIDTVSVNGNSVTVTNNSFVIENVTAAQDVVVKYLAFTPEDMPTISGVKDLYVARESALSFDPRVDLLAKDKDNNDITGDITYTSDITNAIGTYTVTYSVTAANGATTTATGRIHVLDSINPKHVVAATPTVDDIGSRNGMDQAQILVDGVYAPSSADHSDNHFMPWKNTDNIEIVVALDGTTQVSQIGYSLVSAPNVGALPPDVKFYVADKIGVGKATDWTYVGKLEAELHTLDFNTYDHIERTVDIASRASGYVKVVICFDDDADMLSNYSGTQGGGVPEWTFVDEILIGASYEVGDVDISAMNVLYENDGTMSVNIHCQNPVQNEKLIINNADGTPSKYGTIEASDENFVDSCYAGSTLPAGTKMYVIKNISAQDFNKKFVITRVVDETYTSLPQTFSLENYFVDVVEGNTVYPEGTSDSERAADRKVAAASLNYGIAAATAFATEYDGNGGVQKKTVYWNGKSASGIADTSAGTVDDPIIITSAEELHYLADATESETSGKYYQIADDIEAIVLQEQTYADNANILENLSADDVKSVLSNAEGRKTWNLGNNSFAGHLDGNGVAIYGMYSTTALFYQVTQGAGFENFAIRNSFTDSTYYAAALFCHSMEKAGVTYTVEVKNVEISNCYVQNTQGNDKTALVAANTLTWTAANNMGIVIDTCLIYGNKCLYSVSGTPASAGIVGAISNFGEDNETDTLETQFSNSIVLGNVPWSVWTNGANAVRPWNYENVYTDTLDPVPYPVTLNWNTMGDYNNKVFEVEAANLLGSAAEESCNNLDWGTAWLSGDEGELPRLSFGDVATNAETSKKTVYWESGNAASSFAKGNGSEADPYIIATAEELALAVRQNTGSYYKVDESIGKIVLQSEANAQAILNITSAKNGKDVYEGLTNLKSWFTSDNGTFNGHFDGSGVEIYGLYRNDPNASYNKHVALFPVILSSSTFKNFAIKNSYIVSYGRVSAVAASVEPAANESSATVTTKFENIEISNNYLATTREDVVSILAMGRAAACLNYNNLLVYGNSAHRCTTEKDISTLAEYNQLYYYVKNTSTAADDVANKFSNSIILGCSIVVSGQGNAAKAENFTNVYTDQAIADIDAASNSSATDFNGRIFTVSLADIKGAAAEESCKNLDWGNTWFAGNSYGYPSFTKTTDTMPLDLQAVYNQFTVSGEDTYKIFDNEFGMYATSVNLKANPHIAFTFAFHGEYKENRDNITVTFTTANGKTVTTTVGDGNGGVSAGWTNNSGAGRYHLYRLTDISVLDLAGEITVTVSYGGTDYDFGSFSIAGFAGALQEAYEQDPCAYYSTRIEAMRALLFYIDALGERYTNDTPPTPPEPPVDEEKEDPDKNFGEDDDGMSGW